MLGFMVSFLNSLLTTFVIMLLAEIADKTNLLALSLMSETKQPKLVALGGLAGIAVVTFIGIIFGSLLQVYLPEDFIKYLSGFVFILLGIYGLVSNEDEELEVETEHTEKSNHQKNAFLRAAILIGFAEFGDKSQIFVISISLVNNPIAVFLGAVLGMGVIMLLTVLFGENMLKRVPEEKLHLIASILFIVVGLWILVF